MFAPIQLHSGVLEAKPRFVLGFGRRLVDLAKLSMRVPKFEVPESLWRPVEGRPPRGPPTMAVKMGPRLTTPLRDHGRRPSTGRYWPLPIKEDPDGRPKQEPHWLVAGPLAAQATSEPLRLLRVWSRAHMLEVACRSRVCTSLRSGALLLCMRGLRARGPRSGAALWPAHTIGRPPVEGAANATPPQWVGVAATQGTPRATSAPWTVLWRASRRVRRGPGAEGGDENCSRHLLIDVAPAAHSPERRARADGGLSFEGPDDLRAGMHGGFAVCVAGAGAANVSWRTVVGRAACALGAMCGQLPLP